MVATLEEAENGTAAPPVVRGIPIKAGPGIVGAQVGPHLRPPAVSVPATILDMDEQVGHHTFLHMAFASKLKVLKIHLVLLLYIMYQVFQQRLSEG